MAVVRFDSLEALDAWRIQPEHLEAQEKDRALWSERYWIQVSSTVREYQWTRGVDYRDDLRAKFSAGSEIPSAPESSQAEPGGSGAPAGRAASHFEANARAAR